MIEGSDHKTWKKTLVEQFFADHPDMAQRRQRRLEHKRNDDKTMVDETAPATPLPEPKPKVELEADVVVECVAHPSTGSVAPDCAPGTCTRRLVVGAKECLFQARTRAPPDMGFDDEDVENIAVDAGV